MPKEHQTPGNMSVEAAKTEVDHMNGESFGSRYWKIIDGMMDNYDKDRGKGPKPANETEAADKKNATEPNPKKKPEEKKPKMKTKDAKKAHN